MSPGQLWMSQADAKFSFRRSGRSWTALISVVGIWAVLVFAIAVFDAAPWLMAAIALFTLPAAWDFWQNVKAGLDMDEHGLTWFAGRRSAHLSWAEVDRFRLDTRLDFSVRATAVLKAGGKVRLPYESTPHHKQMEAELSARGIPTERHHFSLIG